MSGELFGNDPVVAAVPLAEQMRPQRLSEVYGQEQLLAAGCPLHELRLAQGLHSMVLWGPPGSGKTTIARLASACAAAELIALPAVHCGSAEIRHATEKARLRLRQGGGRSVLFVDEVHCLNRVQQNIFLPIIEDGTIILIGATTENPAFALINALLSRLQLHVLQPLSEDSLLQLLRRAAERLRSEGRVLAHGDEALLGAIAAAADGDARRALNLLEQLQTLPPDDDSGRRLAQLVAARPPQGDRHGDLFYEQISALHKALRGSDPDASLFWLARMLESGCDPLYIARRLLRMASEDIGNADPRALQLALCAWQTQERLGSPEGELALAQAVVFLACAPKSNAVYRAFDAARAAVRRHSAAAVPMRLRNASTRLAARLGHGAGYRYPHDEPGAHASGEHYFPDEMSAELYYHPSDRGLEARIAERLAHWRGAVRESERPGTARAGQR